MPLLNGGLPHGAILVSTRLRIVATTAPKIRNWCLRTASLIIVRTADYLLAYVLPVGVCHSEFHIESRREILALMPADAAALS